MSPSPRPVAIVTGGARGIGAAIVARLRADGFVVVTGDLRGDPSTPDVPRLDVTDAGARETFVGYVADRYGRVDVLVNDAGVNDRRTALRSTWPEWRALFDVNVGGTLEMSRCCHPHLVRRRGCVVNVASTGGHVAIPGAAGYGVSKAAVLHLTRILAVEWAPRVRVNSVSPTLVRTDMTADVVRDREYMAAKLATIPLGRTPEPADVAAAVAFLCGPSAVCVTAQDVAVDGGVVAR
ncbi:MAG TPA: SDR family oxidoreductase [Mycobacteriales bacterium]|nr:SDR family oxidoreductase [Mycobacteriales bacterium]